MFGLPGKLNSTLYWMTQRLRLPVFYWSFTGSDADTAAAPSVNFQSY